MELDDLKQTWKDTQPEKNLNTDIMELIQHKTYGPLAELKKVFRKQMALMTLLPAILILSNLSHVNDVLRSILFWAYVVFCIGVVSFLAYNYKLVEKMEFINGNVKSSLEQQVSILEKNMKWKMIGLRCTAIFFIVLLEVVPYIQHLRMLDRWHALNPLFRFGIYTAFLILQFFMIKRVNQRKTGRHIDYMKKLVSDMQ